MMHRCIYLIDINNKIDFSRRRGSKDKLKRKPRSVAQRILQPTLTAGTLGGLVVLPNVLRNEMFNVQRTVKEAAQLKEKHLANIDANSMQVYGDTLHQLKMNGLDHKTASIYADKAKQEFIELQHGMFEHTPKARINYRNVAKTAAHGIAGGAVVGLGLGLGDLALRQYAKKQRERRKKLQRK